MLVSLGYVQLVRDMTVKIKDPGHAQFWQLRTVALKLRDAEAEAKEAYMNGNLRPFDAGRLVAPADHWIAEGYQKTTVASSRVPTRFASFATANSTSHTDQHAKHVGTGHQAYRTTAHDFALAYNRELNRLMNNSN